MSEPRPLIQADPGEPHWVVVTMARTHLEAPREGQKGWRYLFRHPTKAAAESECMRLAANHPGICFRVYGSGISVKIDAPAEAAEPTVQAASEGAGS